MKKPLPDAFIIIGIFAVWRTMLWGVQTASPFFWPLREGFLGLVTPWANFDGAHYASIAKDGYGVYQTAFFPVYPILIRIVTSITKLPFEYTAILISHFAFLAGLFLFWRYLGEGRNRVWTTVFLLLYPVSFFFAAGYSESIFFALAAGALLAIKRKRWLLTGVLVAFASATRLVGVFLIFPLLFSKRWAVILLAPTGLMVYMGYLWKTLGDPLAFFHVQSSFGAGRSGGELIVLPQVLWRYARIFTTVSPWQPLYHVAILEISTFFLGVILLVVARRNRYDPALLLYSACVLLIPTLTGTLSSMPRYLLAAFPLFSVLGGIRSVWVKIGILVVFTAGFIYAATGFLRGFFIS